MTVTGLAGVFGFAKQPDREVIASSPYDTAAAPTNEIQSIAITGVPTGGTFTLTLDGQTTGPIAYNAIASAVKTAIEALSNVDLGAITAGGGPLPGTAITATFGGNWAGVNVPLMTADAALLTGGTSPAVVVTTPTPGESVWTWLPALNVNFQPNQIVNSIPPEVGGSLWTRGSYKGGVSGAGQVTFVPRGGLGMAELFRGFCGDMAKVTGNGTNGAGANLQVGAFEYTYTPADAAAELPWYTIVRNVGGKIIEQYGDARIGSFGFDLAATGILQVDASFVSRQCAIIPLGTAGGDTDVQDQTAPNGLPFQAVDAVVKLDSNVGGAPGALAVTPYKPTRLNIGFMNQLSTNEYVVGSNFLQDVTNQARTAQISYSVYLTDAELYSRVYAHGDASADGSVGAAWNSQIWKGALELVLIGGFVSGSSGNRFTITVSIPEMDYQAFPVSLSGNNLVEVQLTANVVLSLTPGVQPFTIVYRTNENIS